MEAVFDAVKASVECGALLLGSAAARDRSPPKSRTAIEVLIETWRASGPSTPRKLMEALFDADKASVECGALLLGSAAARDRSPPKSGTAIEVLIETWRASGPSAPYWSMPASFCRNKPFVQCGALYWVSRLRGTAASKVKNGDRSSDP